MNSSSGAGKASACRRRDMNQSAFFCFRFLLGVLLLVKIFLFLKPSRTLTNQVHLARDKTTNNKRGRWCAKIFTVQPLIEAPMSEPRLEEPLISGNEVQRTDLISFVPQSQSRKLFTREEPSYQASLIAGDHIPGLSDAPCLVETSTAHDELLLTVTLTESTIPSWFPSSASHLSQRPQTRVLLPSSCQIAVYPYSGGCIFIISPPAENLGFWLLGLSLRCGPFLLARSTFEILSPSPNYSRPRFNSFFSSPSPLVKICRSSALIDRNLCSCPKTILCIWSCKFIPQTLLLISLVIKVDERLTLKTIDENLFLKTIDENLFLKSLSRAYLGSLSGNQLCLFRHVHSAKSLPGFIFINHTLKHLETESTHRPQSRVVNSLFLIQLSRTMTYWPRQISRVLFRTAFLYDLKGPWHPSALVTKRTSALPSSYMERICPRSLTASFWLVPVTHEVKYPFSTSQNLLIVTISKIPELFAEVSSTHHDLVCGMLLDSLCFRVSMNLSLKFIAYFSYLMYVVKHLFQNYVPFIFLPFGI